MKHFFTPDSFHGRVQEWLKTYKSHNSSLGFPWRTREEIKSRYVSDAERIALDLLKLYVKGNIICHPLLKVQAYRCINDTSYDGTTPHPDNVSKEEWSKVLNVKPEEVDKIIDDFKKKGYWIEEIQREDASSVILLTYPEHELNQPPDELDQPGSPRVQVDTAIMYLLLAILEHRRCGEEGIDLGEKLGFNVVFITLRDAIVEVQQKIVELFVTKSEEYVEVLK